MKAWARGRGVFFTAWLKSGLAGETPAARGLRGCGYVEEEVAREKRWFF